MTDDLTKSPATLLFVDDEPNILKALRRLFRGNEYVIHMAEGGEEGLKILSEHPIDLVISDMRMPYMDGTEFLTQVAERWPDTIRILLTGFADLESTIAAINKGKIFCYCSKPWEDNELKFTVNNAIEQKRLREERQRLMTIISNQNAELKELNEHLEEKVQKRTAQLRQSLNKIDESHEALQKQFTETVKAFNRSIEMRPGIKSGQSKYVAEHARNLAMRLGMNDDEVKDVLYAGLLSQLGKMSLPDHLLQQALFKMTMLERKRYLSHAQEGWRLLQGIERLKNAAELILMQYERLDGSGEPHGYEGNQIPLGARILAVVRDYICYLDGFFTGKPMSVADAQERLQQKKNIHYDPQVIDAFLLMLTESATNDERPIIEVTWTQLHPGMEVAEIIFNNAIYLKDQVLTQSLIDKVLEMRRHSKDMTILVRI